MTSIEALQISVIIATRNREQYLAQALESLCHQSVPADVFEVIVVDNGSTDGSRATAESYCSRRRRWKTLSEPKAGAAAARNSGIRIAAAPWLLFLDDDVIADVNLVEEHLKARQKSADDAILGSVRFPWSGEGPLSWCLRQHPELLQSFRVENPNNVSFLHFYTCNLSMPRFFFEEHPGFDESFTASGFEDIELGYRFTRGGGKLVLHEKASLLHDVQLSFEALSRKRYESGRWARHLANKHPELRTVLGGSPSLRAQVSSALGWLATVFRSRFDRPTGQRLRPLVPLLGFLCWHHLQYRFRIGYQQAGRPLAEPCGNELV